MGCSDDVSTVMLLSLFIVCQANKESNFVRQYLSFGNQELWHHICAIPTPTQGDAQLITYICKHPLSDTVCEYDRNVLKPYPACNLLFRRYNTNGASA